MINISQRQKTPMKADFLYFYKSVVFIVFVGITTVSKVSTNHNITFSIYLV